MIIGFVSSFNLLARLLQALESLKPSSEDDHGGMTKEFVTPLWSIS
jgi:hypothetical protein